MRKFFPGLLTALAFYATSVSAQKINVNWGDHARMKYSFDDAVPLDNGQMIVLKFKEQRKMSFGSANWEYKPSLLLVDKDMETIREAELPIKEPSAIFMGFEKYGDNIFYLYRVHNRDTKTTTVHAIRIDEKELKIAGQTDLGVFTTESKSDKLEFSYQLSLDSSKVLLFVELPEKKNQNERFFIHVFDNSFHSIWKRAVELPIPSKFVDVYDKDLTNDGKVIMALKHYDKEVKREAVKEDGEKIPSYVYKLLVFQPENEEPKEIVFNLENKFVQGTKLTYNLNHEITIAGLYKQKYNGRINGAFYAILDPQSFAIKTSVITPFPAGLVEAIKKDGFGSGEQSDPGISNAFKILNVVNRENGSVDLVAEYKASATHYSTSSSGRSSSYTIYYYGDILNTNISKDGQAVFTRIPKNQRFINYSGYLGSFPVVYQNKLVLLYNDAKKNISRDLSKTPDDMSKFKKSVFVAATIDEKGNVSRQVVYDHSKMEYITHPRFIEKINRDTYLLSAGVIKMLTQRSRFGIMQVK